MSLQLPLSEWHRLAAETLVASSGGRLSLTEAEREGSDLWAICRTCAVVAEAITHRAVMALARVALDTATGEHLDRLVFDAFGGLRRQSAQPARGTLAIRMLTGSPDAVTVPQNTALLSGGIRYVTLAEVVIPAGNTANHAVDAQSDVAGAGRNATAGAVWSFEAPPDSRLRAANAAAIAGSADAETDAALRARARRYWATQQRGTRGALELGALAVSGVRRVSVEELVDPDGDPAPGYVTVYVADEDGESSATMTTAVEAEEENWRAAGVVLSVIGGAPESVPVVLRITTLVGYDAGTIRERVTGALVAVGQRLSPGEILRRASLWAAVVSVPGVVAPDSAIVAPLGDVAPTSSNRVLRIGAGDVSFV